MGLCQEAGGDEKRCCTCLRAILLKLLFVRADSPPNNPGASHALQPLATLLVFFLTQVVAAVIVEKGKGPQFWNMFWYGILQFWTIVSIFLITRYTSDWLTFKVGRITYRLCTCTSVAFLVLGLSGRLPGQGLLTLGVSNVTYADNVREGLPGLQMYVVITGRQFNWGIPSTTTLYVSLDAETAKAWTPTRAVVEEYLPNGALMPALAKPPTIDVQECGSAMVKIEGLCDGPTYRTTIYFEPSAAAFVEDIRKMTSKNASAIREKWKTFAETECRKIGPRCGIGASLREPGSKP